MQRPQLRQSAQQPPEPLRPPSRSSALGPANPGQQVQDQLLHFFHAVGGLKGGSVCRGRVGGGVGMGKQEVSCRLLTVCDVSLSETHDVICLGLGLRLIFGLGLELELWLGFVLRLGLGLEIGVGVGVRVGIRVWVRVGLQVWLKLGLGLKLELGLWLGVRIMVKVGV